MALPVKVGMNIRVLLGGGNRDGARIRFARVLTVVDQDNITAAFGHGPSFAATRSTQYSKYGLLFIQDSVPFALEDLTVIDQGEQEDATVELNFTFRLTNNGGHEVTDIEAKVDAGSWTPVDTYELDYDGEVGVGSAMIAGFSYDTAYTVRFRAVTAEGNGTQSAELAITVADTASQVPAQPTIDSVTPGDGELSVAWTADWTGGSAITDCEYAIAPAWEGAVFDDWASAGSTSPAVISTLINGQEYDVRIRLVNANGAGAYIDGSGTPSA